MSFLSKVATQANRAKQYAEEQMGHAEKTQLDPELQTDINRAEQIKCFTQKIKEGTEAVIQPNPKVRAEDYVCGKMDYQRANERVTNEEYLGQEMIDAGNQLGPRTPYGMSLIATGQAFTQLGSAHKDYAHASGTKFLQPLHNFLDGDVNAMLKAKQELEYRRLDLDVAKNKAKKAKDKAKGETTPDVDKAERDLLAAQEEFDKQRDILKPMVEGIIRSQEYHQTLLSSYADSLREYYDSCVRHVQHLQSELKSVKIKAPLNQVQDALKKASVW